MTDPQSIQVADIIRKRIETYTYQRRTQLLEIQANICYLVGEQNIQLVGENIRPLDQERVIDSIANVILPAVQKDVAVGTQVAPRFDIVPAGSDADDRATAIACQKIRKFHERILGKDLKRGEAIMWYDIAGVAWRKTYWDADAVVLGANPAKVDEETGEPNPAHIPGLKVGDAIMEGEVAIDVIPPNQLIYDYRMTDLFKLPWMIHAKQVTATYVVDTFGPDIASKLTSQFTTTTKESQFEAGVQNRFETLYNNFSADKQRIHTPKMSHTVMMQLDADKVIDYYEFWQKPSKTSPAGMVAVMLGTQVVAHGPYPIEIYPHGELPFSPAAPLSIAGVTSGAPARISQARPLQREFNRLRSQIAENIDVMGNAVIFAPRQAKLRHKTLDNGAGNIIEYDGPVGRPTREPGVPMNGQVFAYLQETKLAIDNIFAFHEPSQGRAPRNIDSAKGLMALQGADTLHMGPIVTGFEKSDERVVYQTLSLAVANYKQGKLMNVLGSDYQWASYELDRQQLLGKFNVIVKPNSSMPVDKKDESIQAFSLWQSGILGDPQDPEIKLWTLDQMNYGNNDVLLQKHAKQKNFSRMEFVSALEVLKGIDLQRFQGMTEQQEAAEAQRLTFVPPPNVFDDDIVHVKDHSEWLIDNVWKMRSTGNALMLELLNNMMVHTDIHKQKIMMAAKMRHDQQILDQMLIKGKTMEQIMASKSPPASSASTKDKKES